MFVVIRQIRFCWVHLLRCMLLCHVPRKMCKGAQLSIRCTFGPPLLVRSGMTVSKTERERRCRRLAGELAGAVAVAAAVKVSSVIVARNEYSIMGRSGEKVAIFVSRMSSALDFKTPASQQQQQPAPHTLAIHRPSDRTTMTTTTTAANRPTEAYQNQRKQQHHILRFRMHELVEPQSSISLDCETDV